ncbi:lysophospholipid acyltransferase family protein [Paenibacillus mucilaginosus]|uniref:Lipid A biosynthesis acyltransferase n=1 Tax=Paenibacillus mucilaginosus (strain KNP414) TaxID=1036673 RepID=F8F5S2_PAEMK|nr:lipid A biosynthesis acyltransferase [Paenibacillus mucilaginosus]AEI41486.1 lipid A biosynthesis acyltransferase [Paenibacillus mucilaginosus KNP414]MCG7215474.1 lipid A biosynthesis acyltransferase [Paenibacillus mucilaginosus]WDM30497.1 lipid A biosynthesis acyltransferase [Paenibacillus mucilaginosus]
MYEWIRKFTSGDNGWLRLIYLIPRPAVHLLCVITSWILSRLPAAGLPSRVRRNMDDLLGPCGVGERRTLIRQYLFNVFMALYEILVDSGRLPGSRGWRFRVEGERHLAEALEHGRGAIVYTPHIGNFFYSYWYLCQTYDCLTVATAGSPELRPLYLKFAELGCPGLDYDSTPPLELLRKLRSHLKRGGVVFLLGDFYRPSFPAVRFFGKSTRLPAGAAVLSMEGGVPVVPFCSWREKGFVHHLRFEAPLPLASSSGRNAREEVVGVLNTYMERVIREKPAEWFYWFNAEERWEASADHPGPGQPPEMSRPAASAVQGSGTFGA